MSNSTPPAPPRRTTLADIAEVCGVHVTTVSMAVRSVGRMAQATRRRILHAAQTLGYTRNPTLFALSARRLSRTGRIPSPRIAFLSSHSDRKSFLRFEHMKRFLQGAEAQAQSLGYQCDLVCVGAWRRRQSLNQWLKENGYQGIVLGPLHPAQRLPAVDWSQFELVKIDSRFHGPKATFVSNDQAQVVRLSLDRLRSRGYRRIGLAVGEIDEQTTDHLFQMALLLAQSQWDPSERTHPFHFGLREANSVARLRLARWVKEERLDALLINRHDARQLCAPLHCPGHPLGIAILSLPQDELCLSGVRQNHEQVGRLAVERLVARLHNAQLGLSQEPTETFVEGHWHEGTSTPGRSGLS